MAIARTGFAAACLLIGLGFGGSPAAARGLCNIDSVGTPPDRKNVATAATQLYTGGKAIMDSLAAFEGDDRDAGQKNASIAGAAFKLAADSYAKLTNELKVDLRRVSDVAPATLAEAAAAAPNDVLQQLLVKAKQPDASQQLMAECGQAATRMANATAQFQKDVAATPDREAPYARLLAEWGRLVFTGRIVSVMFELGGTRN